MSATIDQTRPIFYHGTRADLAPGYLNGPGYSSNYGQRCQANFVYFSASRTSAKGASGR